MSAPATLPRWGDISAAIVVPTSGKLDVGWIAGERPPAQYLNWWQNLVYQWIVYLNSAANVGWHDTSPASGAMTGMSLSSGSYVNSSNVAGTIDQIPLAPRVGDVITDIRTYYAHTSGFTVSTLDILLKKALGGVVTTIGTLHASITDLGGTTWTSASLTLGSPETVVDGAAYYFHVDVPASSGTVAVTSVGYKVGT